MTTALEHVAFCVPLPRDQSCLAGEVVWEAVPVFGGDNRAIGYSLAAGVVLVVADTLLDRQRFPDRGLGIIRHDDSGKSGRVDEESTTASARGERRPAG